MTFLYNEVLMLLAIFFTKTFWKVLLCLHRQLDFKFYIVEMVPLNHFTLCLKWWKYRPHIIARTWTYMARCYSHILQTTPSRCLLPPEIEMTTSGGPHPEHNTCFSLENRSYEDTPHGGSIHPFGVSLVFELTLPCLCLIYHGWYWGTLLLEYWCRGLLCHWVLNVGFRVSNRT